MYAASVFVKHANGTDFVLADRRFDLGDWNGDGKPDLVTGTYSGNIQLFLNTGTAADPRFSTGTTLFSESYQIYPRLYDLNGNGLVDFLRGINWGSIVYWRDAGSRGLVSSTTLTLTDSSGVSPDLHALTDGAMVDFGDFNGDGKPDLVVGGHCERQGLSWPTASQKTVAESIAEIEAIYDANPTNVGVALSANTNALLNVVNNANWNLISHLQNGTLGTREALYTALTNHIGKYWFLKYQTLDTTNFHHVPSIVLQNWVMLQYALADTPDAPHQHRRRDGPDRHHADDLPRNRPRPRRQRQCPSRPPTARSATSSGAIRASCSRMRSSPSISSTATAAGASSGRRTAPRTPSANGPWATRNEWAGDLTTAIEKVLGAGSASGDYFTFVMGHEVTHSLDGYVNSRANTDLRKRWGLMLCTAAGPDVIPGANGWWDWTADEDQLPGQGLLGRRFGQLGRGVVQLLGGRLRVASSRISRSCAFDISWFLGAPQESLATQANHHWANGPGRLIGATDRFRRATSPGLPPAARPTSTKWSPSSTYLSAGMNRVNLVETKNPHRLAGQLDQPLRRPGAR